MNKQQLAERLIADIDALEAQRNLAVYERDARLVARWFLAQGRALEAARQINDSWGALGGTLTLGHPYAQRLKRELAYDEYDWIEAAAEGET